MLQIHHKREVLSKLEQAQELISEFWYWSEDTQKARFEAVERHLEILSDEFYKSLQEEELTLLKSRK